ncbi:unnamed protein product [Allacma fusca]|uniref:Peptidase C76 domain-containing protein n=1 Tax=Allacma fusca TaxID=39272 RepID=A0A8J2PN51_9HEXA|nr:unnamed protein product [Allacma fusca]
MSSYGLSRRKKPQPIVESTALKFYEEIDYSAEDIFLKHEVSYLQSKTHQGNNSFGPAAGKQCCCIAINFLVTMAVSDPDQWDQKTLDELLNRGTKLYLSVDQKFHDKNGYISHEALMHVYCYKKLKKQVLVNEKSSHYCVFNQLLDKQSNLNSIAFEILVLLKNIQYALIVANGHVLGLAKRGSFVYLFNSHAVNSKGLTTSEGKATLHRMHEEDSSELLSYLLNKNYSPTLPISNESSLIVGIYVLTMTPEELTSDTSDDDFVQVPGKPSLHPNKRAAGKAYNELPTHSKKSRQNDTDLFNCDGASGIYCMYDFNDTSNILDKLGTIDDAKVQTSCVTKENISNRSVIVYSVKAMESSIDTFWRNDDAGFKYGCRKLLPSGSPKWKCTYYYRRSDVGQILWCRKEFVRWNIDGLVTAVAANDLNKLNFTMVRYTM